MIPVLAWFGMTALFIGLVICMKLMRAAIIEGDIHFVIGFGCSAWLCGIGIASLATTLGAA
jgi:hypothetical protein